MAMYSFRSKFTCGVPLHWIRRIVKSIQLNQMSHALKPLQNIAYLRACASRTTRMKRSSTGSHVPSRSWAQETLRSRVAQYSRSSVNGVGTVASSFVELQLTVTVEIAYASHRRLKACFRNARARRDLLRRSSVVRYSFSIHSIGCRALHR